MPATISRGDRRQAPGSASPLVVETDRCPLERTDHLDHPALTSLCTATAVSSAMRSDPWEVFRPPACHAPFLPHRAAFNHATVAYPLPVVNGTTDFTLDRESRSVC